MKESLEILYGELMQLHLNTSDWLPKNQYLEKMKAIETLLNPVVYDLPDPVLQKAKKGMEKIQIYHFQLDTIQNTMRLMGNIYKMRTKESCLSRDFVQSEKFIKNALEGKIDERVSRF